ncbi:hypothetical protein [Thermococcus sp. MAR1]|uniref:hypothetical protein n=1 Tax=Thermococcus sp. MAR1 TaxID=1638263 RepID=UPI00143C9E34|nr:hypothetical protein [Thermococcus sp. MAR1]NJE09334.1 hypothetical protein [Thermococcus sp. MAR1]
MELGDEVVDNLIGVIAIVSGVVLVLWKPAILGFLALVMLGALAYHEASPRERWLLRRLSP